MSDYSTTDSTTSGDGGGDFTALADFFSESGLDSIWLDLDGDQVPDTQISSYTPSASASDDPFTVATDDGGTIDSTVYDSSDSSDYDQWCELPADWADSAYYDMPMYPETTSVDWTATDAYTYDPMDMWNFSVESGPVIFDPASGDSYTPTDYTDPSLWFNSSSFDSGAGYWDPTYSVMPTQPDYTMWEPTSDGYTADGFSYDPFAYPTQPADVYSMPGYDDYSSSYTYTTPGYDSTDYTSWSGDSTDVVTDYFTDYSFDNQLYEASSNSQYWMDEYNSAEDLSWEYWQASVDASTAGDSSLAYDYNQLSLEANSYADTAWDNSASSWDYTSSSSWDTSSSADDGWYDAMSLD